MASPGSGRSISRMIRSPSTSRVAEARSICAFRSAKDRFPELTGTGDLRYRARPASSSDGSVGSMAEVMLAGFHPVKQPRRREEPQVLFWLRRARRGAMKSNAVTWPRLLQIGKTEIGVWRVTSGLRTTHRARTTASQARVTSPAVGLASWRMQRLEGGTRCPGPRSQGRDEEGGGVGSSKAKGQRFHCSAFSSETCTGGPYRRRKVFAETIAFPTAYVFPAGSAV